jgi:hypothetical protein
MALVDLSFTIDAPECGAPAPEEEAAYVRAIFEEIRDTRLYVVARIEREDGTVGSYTFTTAGREI